jgi:hypothetical protein
LRSRVTGSSNSLPMFSRWFDANYTCGKVPWRSSPHDVRHESCTKRHADTSQGSLNQVQTRMVGYVNTFKKLLSSTHTSIRSALKLSSSFGKIHSLTCIGKDKLLGFSPLLTHSEQRRAGFCISHQHPPRR